MTSTQACLKVFCCKNYFQVGKSATLNTCRLLQMLLPSKCNLETKHAFYYQNNANSNVLLIIESVIVR